MWKKKALLPQKMFGPVSDDSRCHDRVAQSLLSWRPSGSSSGPAGKAPITWPAAPVGRQHKLTRIPFTISGIPHAAPRCLSREAGGEGTAGIRQRDGGRPRDSRL